MPFALDDYFTISQLTKKTWLLRDSFTYYNSSIINEPVIVPRLIISDGSSIPRIVWPVIGHPLEGEFAICGFFHDFLYTVKTYNQKTCDMLYKEALTGLGCPFWKAQVCYIALRAFGWLAWSKRSLDGLKNT